MNSVLTAITILAAGAAIVALIRAAIVIMAALAFITLLEKRFGKEKNARSPT